MFHARTLQDMVTKPQKAEPMPDLKPAVEGPMYPWGLSLRMDQETLDKLGLDVPRVGDLLHFCAVGKVTAVSQHEIQSEGESRKHCCAEVQITEIGIPSEDEEEEAEERRKGWYGGNDDNDG
jgi:hypothetical protein